MAKRYAALTVRKLKPGSYAAWRKAWEPATWPEGVSRAYILRNLADADEVIAVGMFEGDIDAVRKDPEFQAEQRRRLDAMVPHIASIGADGMYELVEEITPSGAS